MRIMVVGHGGREDALHSQLVLSEGVTALFGTGENPGILARGVERVPCKVTDIEGLKKFALENRIDLTVVGPEEPLLFGIVDEFKKHDLTIFGPTKKAARLEGDKGWAQELMNRSQVPTARSAVFISHLSAAQYVRTPGNTPCFVKASGPALGKGAIPCEDIESAERALHELMLKGKFGIAGKKVVIQEWLRGKEVSAHALCDEHDEYLFPFARDHKRELDGDNGDQTGGLGTVTGFDVQCSTAASITEHMIVHRILEALAQQEIPYKGLLFPGIMLTDQGPKVLEFNCRFGDPETQAYMVRWKGDLAKYLHASATNTLRRLPALKWRPGASCCVVMTSGGYPNPPEGGYPQVQIEGIQDAEEIPGVTVFHSGTIEKYRRIHTNGGRVLSVTAFRPSLKEAIETAYKAVAKISFEGMQYRTDIGASSLH